MYYLLQLKNVVSLNRHCCTIISFFLNTFSLNCEHFFLSRRKLMKFLQSFPNEVRFVLCVPFATFSFSRSRRLFTQQTMLYTKARLLIGFWPKRKSVFSVETNTFQGRFRNSNWILLIYNWYFPIITLGNNNYIHFENCFSIGPFELLRDYTIYSLCGKNVLE